MRTRNWHAARKEPAEWKKVNLLIRNTRLKRWNVIFKKDPPACGLLCAFRAPMPAILSRSAPRPPFERNTKWMIVFLIQRPVSLSANNARIYRSASTHLPAQSLAGSNQVTPGSPPTTINRSRCISESPPAGNLLFTIGVWFRRPWFQLTEFSPPHSSGSYQSVNYSFRSWSLERVF